MVTLTPIIKADGLWKNYGNRAVVKGVSLELTAGEVLGLLGPNGAGKTTTVGMLYGAVMPTKGAASIGGMDVLQDGRNARRLLGVVQQEDTLDPDFTVVENLRYFAHHFRLTRTSGQKRAKELLQQVGLSEYHNYKIDELSGGLRRRLILARALINQPQIIFLDEPTTGLDPDARQDFWKLIFELKREGRGVLLTTHYMEEAERLCDRLLLIQDGVIVDQGSPQELISKIAGLEVVEIEGVSANLLQELAQKAGSWSRNFSSGYLIALPKNEPNLLWRELEKLSPTKISRRRANLEDVFLILTGKSLT